MGKKRRRKKNKKGKKLFLLIVFVLIAVIIARCNVIDRSHDTRVVGYLPTWYYSSLDDIDFDNLTHVNLAFVNPDSTGNLHCSLAEDNIRKIVKKAKKHDVKVLVALGGGNGFHGYAKLIADEDARNNFNDKILEFINYYGFDGIDLNIEGDVEPEFWDNYDIWVKELEKKCHRNDLLLTCAIASWFDEYITDKTLSRFDFVSVMAYDNRGDSENPSTYDFAEKQMSYFSGRKIKKSKLVLGIPFYGYRYVDGVCTNQVVTYAEIAKYNKDSEHYDASGTCRYNGLDTVSKKAVLGKSYGGVMVWCLGQDATGKKSLLRAIGKALK